MREEKISKASTPSRLFARDESYLKRQVKDRGNTDTRFKDNSAAVRHYVHLGITTERRTESANTLNDRIIKNAQREVVTDTLLPLKNSIDDLITKLEGFEKKQDVHFANSVRENESIFRRVEVLSDLSSQQFANIFRHLEMSDQISIETLRNSITVRSLFYVFLMGIKGGRIDPNDRTAWEKLVTSAHTKIRQLTDKELNLILDGEYETQVVKKLANEMFAEIKNLLKDLPVKTTDSQ